jgi:hypothetical protein
LLEGSMRNARHVIAVTLVATAICADRMAIAAPMQVPVAQIAGRLIHRLTTRFARVVPAARLYQPRREGARCPQRESAIASSRAVPLRVSLSAFQFRLPPPTA